MVALPMVSPPPKLIGPERVKSRAAGSVGTAAVRSEVLSCPAESVMSPSATLAVTPLAVMVRSLPLWARVAETMLRLAAVPTARWKSVSATTSVPSASGWFASV